MNGSRRALRAAILADTASSALQGGSSTTVLQLASGAAASEDWQNDDVCYVHAVAGSASNEKRIVRVTDVDLAQDKLTVEPALATAPSATDTINRGLKTWLQATPIVKYKKPAYSTPIDKLIDDLDTRSCVCFFGMLPRKPIVFHAWAEDWEIRFICREDEPAESAAARATRRFHQQTGLLTITGVTVSRFEITNVEERDRDDKLFEWVVAAHIELARKAVAA